MMKATMQPWSLKVKPKFSNDKNAGNSSITAGHLNDAEEERDASNSPNLTRNPSTPENIENHDTENDGNQISENSEYQLVLYDPAIDGGNAADPANVSPLQRIHPFSDRTPRILPSVGAFTVQCAYCFKWRLIPTKDKYEEIREHIVERPFFCETAREWRPDVSCDDPPDITQDGSRLWAIDKPNIAQPPPGWERLLRIRGEGSTKFADVYYVAPSGKRLRSVVEIQKYLDKHPEYMEEGVSLSKFSFQIPKPLQENYVRRRPSRSPLPNDAGDLVVPQYLPPPEGPYTFTSFGDPGGTEVERKGSTAAPLSLLSSDVDMDLQLSRPGLSDDHFEAPGPIPETQLAKKRRIPPSNWTYHDDLVYDCSGVNVEEPHHF